MARHPGSLPRAGAIAAALLIAPLATAVHAAESYSNCTGYIDTIPAAITAQGTWCLRKDLATALTNAAVIDIRTNNVTLDCNDFKIGGMAAGAGTLSAGVQAVSRVNVTVRNCNIRGFAYGIKLPGGSGHVVEDNRLIANTVTGIDVEGDGAIVRENQITDTGGSAAVLGEARGIRTVGSVFVQDNQVSGVAPTANGAGNATSIGILTSANARGSVRGNRVRALLPVGAGTAVGIKVDGDVALLVERNDVIGAATGTGVQCQTAKALTLDNTVLGFAAQATGCTALAP